MTKSALASYAEESGIVVPLIIDFTLLGRQFLTTDGIGIILLVTLQSYMAYKSTKRAKKDFHDKGTYEIEGEVSINTPLEDNDAGPPRSISQLEPAQANDLDTAPPAMQKVRSQRIPAGSSST